VGKTVMALPEPVVAWVRKCRLHIVISPSAFRILSFSDPKFWTEVAPEHLSRAVSANNDRRTRRLHEHRQPCKPRRDSAGDSKRDLSSDHVSYLQQSPRHRLVLQLRDFYRPTPTPKFLNSLQSEFLTQSGCHAKRRFSGYTQ